MHPDLALIVGLWEVDKATDAAQDRARALKSAVDAAQAQMASIAEAQAAIDAEKARVEIEEAAQQKQLDRYVIRRDRTKELLKGGSALDYITVERQLRQCTEKVGELEAKVMDCMAEVEALDARSAGLVDDASVAARAHQAARMTWIEEGRELRTELEALAADRAARWAEFPKDLHSHYNDLRRRKKAVVVPIDGSNCSACQMTVNAQVKVDLTAGRRVHTCRGCHRYLTLPVDADPDEA